MLNKVFRIVVCLSGALVGYGITTFSARPEILGDAWGMTPGQKVLWICTGTAFFAFIFDFLFGFFRKRGEKIMETVDSRLKKVPATEIAASSIGLVVGFVIAFLISQIINEIQILRAMNLNVVISLALYLFFGVLTTVVSFASAGLAKFVLEHAGGYSAGDVSNISTVFSWVCAVTFAYITNKLWVFDSPSFDKQTLLHEIPTFFGARLATGILDVVIMYLAVDVAHMNPTVWKLISNVIVIILNYVASKFVIFKKKEEVKDTEGSAEE